MEAPFEWTRRTSIFFSGPQELATLQPTAGYALLQPAPGYLYTGGGLGMRPVVVAWE